MSTDFHPGPATTADEATSTFFYPPGGLLIWIVILLELLTFGLGFLGFAMAEDAGSPAWLAARASLDVPLATVNTVILLTSGLAVALGVAAWQRDRRATAIRWTLAAAGLGVAFTALKVVEYVAKWDAGLGPAAGSFFGFYWGLTAFHLLHVLAGIVMLLWMARRLRSQAPFAPDAATPATTAAFWHMCDLVWVFLFPLLYLGQ